MTRMVPSQKMPNFSVSVRSVPDVVDTIGFTTTEPASAIMKMIGG